MEGTPSDITYMDNYLSVFALFSIILQIWPPFCEAQAKLKGTTDMTHCWVLKWVCDFLQLVTWEPLHVAMYTIDVDPKQLQSVIE